MAYWLWMRNLRDKDFVNNYNEYLRYEVMTTHVCCTSNGGSKSKPFPNARSLSVTCRWKITEAP